MYFNKINYGYIKYLEQDRVNQRYERRFYQIVVITLLALIFSVLFSSCKKFIDVGPPKTELIGSTVFQSDEATTAAVIGIYSQMVGNGGFASGDRNSIATFAGLSSDELINYSTSANPNEFYNNSLNPANTALTNFLWSDGYEYIYSTNVIIEGINKSSSLTPSIKSQLLGEVKFVRAFCYFYLTTLFGEVPLHTTTDYRITSVAKQATISELYSQMISDLVEAQSLLPEEYPDEERVRPNKAAATALLSRVYLFNHEWGKAEAEATKVINNTGSYELLSNLNDIFLMNSKEAIWQLRPVNPDYNTQEGQLFILTSTPRQVSLRKELLGAFELDDSRKQNWIDSIVTSSGTYFYPYKYKIRAGSTLQEYSMVLRLAEQYLIRAEARLQQDNLNGANTDLNAIRARAGLDSLPVTEKEMMLEQIFHERQLELFSEWGHRWLDLKRWVTSSGTPKASELLKSLKPDWSDTDVLYPIPQRERNNNPNITQNPGY